MKRQEAMNVLSKYTDDDISPVVADAHRYAMDCVEHIGYLKDRPCEVCVFNGEGGCKRWNCTFDELIYEGSEE